MCCSPRPQQDDQQALRTMEHEAAVLLELVSNKKPHQHPNVVELLGHCLQGQGGSRRFLALELGAKSALAISADFQNMVCDPDVTSSETGRAIDLEAYGDIVRSQELWILYTVADVVRRMRSMHQTIDDNGQHPTELLLLLGKH